MKFKNIIATGLLTATLLGTTTTTLAQTIHFNDVPQGHWSESSIYYLADKGVISGYGDAKFGFGDNVTRGQVSAILARYLHLQNNEMGSKQFSDIQGHMFEGNIKAVVQAGIMSGDNTDKFRPDDTLTRYEMAVILQKAFNLSINGNGPFNDIPRGHWATDYIRTLYSNGVTSGVGQNQYGGQYSVTREQFAKFMYNSIFKDQNQKPEDNNNIENQQTRVQNILTSSGFFKRGTEYVYNTYGTNGDTLFDVMRVQITPNTNYEYRIFINSDDPSVNVAVKKMFNEILPTKGDYLYNIIDDSGVKKQSLKLDDRTIEIDKGWNLSILVSSINR